MTCNGYHGSLGKNIKVHFAGSDYDHNCLNSLEIAGVNYRLYTVYPVIANKRPGDDLKDYTGTAIRQQQIFKHVILDSGLFTLMFGAKKGQAQTVATLTEWQDKIIQFVEQNKLNCTCVEIDCQKVLGVEQAWYFRKRMKDKLKNRQINVFHYEDGRKGLDRLIEFSDYIAISVPEIRIVKPKTFRKDVHSLADYIKSKKPSIDIHLLGCTDKNMLRDNRFCTTADSSSWTGIYRFASIQGKSAYHLKEDVYYDAQKRWKEFVGDEKWQALTTLNKRKVTWELISAELNKKVYEYYAGNQD